MPVCSYCKKEYNIPRGVTIFMNDGTIYHFCSSKCRKRMNLRRKRTIKRNR